jgi:hypothetical protein
MSALENQAIPVLQPMLAGNSCRLDAATQAIVAAWSLKTAMVLEAVDPSDNRAYTQAERESLRSVTALPWRTTVWLAAFAEPSWFMSTKHRYQGTALAPSGASTTMVFAHLALQVLTIRVPRSVVPETKITTNVRRGPWEQATVQVWSPQSIAATWPPPMRLTGETGIEVLSDRFKPTHDDVSMDTLAV